MKRPGSRNVRIDVGRKMTQQPEEINFELAEPRKEGVQVF